MRPEYSEALRLLLKERDRQTDKLGWSSDHDDHYVEGELAKAASCYALSSTQPDKPLLSMWPWDMTWWNPENRLRMLVKAGALIIAEIERLLRRSDCGEETSSVD